MKDNPHIGSSIDGLLEETGDLAEVSAIAIKRTTEGNRVSDPEFSEWVNAYLDDGSHPEILSEEARCILVRMSESEWVRNEMCGPKFRHRDKFRTYFRSWAVEMYPFLFCHAIELKK